MKKHILTALFFLTTLLFGCNNGSARLDSEIATNKVSLDASSGGVADQAINVSLTPNIVLKFTTTMQPSTINDKTVFLATSALIAHSPLKLQADNLIPISSITANANNTIFHFSPLSPLASNTKYYVIVTNKVQTTTG
ncbi:MAG: Ig-like domain-containing protein, partial [Burkholderiales bacterium]